MTTLKNNQIIQTKARLRNGAAFTVLLALFLVYIYFISVSVSHVVMRKELTNDVIALKSEISNLESIYIERKHQISQDLTTKAQIVAVVDKTFIDKSHTNLVMSN